MADDIEQDHIGDPSLEWNDSYLVVIAGSEMGIEMDPREIVEIRLDDPRVSTPEVHDAIRDALRTIPPLEGYSIQTTRQEVEWGASGASTQVLLLIANAGLGVFLEHGLRALLKGLRGRYADRGVRQSVTEEEAVEAARYTVALR